MEKKLSNLYFEPKQPPAYAGAYHLLRTIKKKKKLGKNSKQKVLSWLAEQDAYTLHKVVRKKFPRRMYNVSNIYDCFEADLADFRSIKSFNDNYTYVLFVIDALSKFLWVEPLKDKSGESVAKALRKLFSNNKDKLCILFQTDKGKEFTARAVQNVFKEFNIEFRLIRNPDAKCAIVERVIKTIKHRLWRYFTYKNTRRYIDVLPSIVHSYNHTVHSGIKMTPASVNLQNADVARCNLIKRYSVKRKKSIKPKYKVGTLVRISRAPEVFRKAYESGWTLELFRIARVSCARQPPVYTLEDLNGEIIDGVYYEQELCHVEKNLNEAVFEIDEILKTKGNGKFKKYLVSWRGYPSQYNSWIAASDLINI